ncbi:MAG: hypothetical protein V3W41_18790 [Planctomycetota bacterium]
MQGDLALAIGILGGSRRSLRAFARRFEDETTAAFQHCMNARQVGLSYDDYLHQVAETSSRSLLAAMPSRDSRIELSRHVRRLLGRRDFALAICMRRGADAAWLQFRERYDSYLETILIRNGYAPGEIETPREELVAEIRGGDEADSPLSKWWGRSDLRHWLLCYVREVFRGGVQMTSQQESEAPRQHSTTDFGRAFISVVKEEFAAGYEELKGHQRELVEKTLRGEALSDMPEDLALLSERHEVILDELWSGLVRRVSRRTQVPKSEVDDLLRETFVGETEAELARLGERGEAAN